MPLNTSFIANVAPLIPMRYRNTVRQFLKFGVTGTIGAVVDFSSYNFLTRIAGWDTILEPFGYKIIAANLVSVLLAISSNFLLNKYWTFRNKEEGAVLKQWSGYFALNSFTFILNQLITSFFTFHVPVLEAFFGSQRDNVAKAIAIGCILFVNFLGSKFLIFRRSSPSSASPETGLP